MCASVSGGSFTQRKIICAASMLLSATITKPGMHFETFLMCFLMSVFFPTITKSHTARVRQYRLWSLGVTLFHHAVNYSETSSTKPCTSLLNIF